MKQIRKTLTVQIAVACALVVCAVTVPASAVIGGNNTVVHVEFNPNYGNPQLLVKSPNGTFYATINAPGGSCPVAARTMDTLKIWENIAQAALLSGKTMRYYYTDCTIGGTTFHFLESLALLQ